MAERNLKKIVIGLMFIVLAIGSGLGAFYLLEVKPEMTRRAALGNVAQPTAPATDRLALAASVSKPTPVSTPVAAPLAKATVSNPVEPVDPVAQTPSDQSRKDGFLWIDRKTSRWVVTLGAIHGLKANSLLAVYQGDKVIGQVKVTRAFDVISYVQPMDGPKFEQSDYFRVVIQ
ncbi:MAG: hypothetical protein Q7S13_06065 [Candidatus Omnitrophota bacterium]|nr:hypothetical protein [Candidatus Omnitrophota bacterium]